MDTDMTELHNINQGVCVEDQEEKIVKVKSHFMKTDLTGFPESVDIKMEIDDNQTHVENGSSHLQNIDQNIDTELPKINQGEKVMREKMFGDSEFENVNNRYLETTKSKFQDIDNPHENMDTMLKTIKHEVKANRESCNDFHVHLENMDNFINVFENKDSNVEVRDNEDDNVFEAGIIKQEIILDEEQVLESENDTDLTTERTDLTTERTDLTNTSEDSSSMIGNLDLKIENIGHDIDSGYLKSNQSEAKADLHPILLIKRLPDVCNQRFQVSPMIQNGFCLPKQSSSSTTYSNMAKEETLSEESNVVISGEIDNSVQINTNLTSAHVCTLCKAEFKSSYLLGKHMEFNHRKVVEAKPLECHKCNLQFTYLSFFRRHLLSHIGQRQYTCDMCEKTFKTASCLRKHMSSHSSGSLHKCPDCSKVYELQSELRKHLITHSTERPHQCNRCGKNFKRPHDLRDHLLSHRTDGPVPCDLCDKQFKRPIDLRDHLVSHSAKQPYPCRVCEKRFKRSPYLRRHMMTHSTENPYQCRVCDKQFKRSHYLRRHMMTHSSEHPDVMCYLLHRCGICHKEFKALKNLKRHTCVTSPSNGEQTSMNDKDIHE